MSHELFSHQFSKLTEKFDPWIEMKRLRFIVEEGILKLECLKTAEERYIDTQGLYAFQDRRIIKYVHGCPQRFISLSLLPIVSPSKKVLRVTLLDKDFISTFCVVEASEDRVFKDLIP